MEKEKINRNQKTYRCKNKWKRISDNSNDHGTNPPPKSKYFKYILEYNELLKMLNMSKIDLNNIDLNNLNLYTHI